MKGPGVLSFVGFIDQEKNSAVGKGVTNGGLTFDGNFILKLLYLSSKNQSFRTPDFYIVYEIEATLSYFKLVFHGNVTFEFRHAKYIGECKTGNVEGFGSLTFLEPLVNSTSEMTKIESYFLNTSTLHGNTTIIYNNGRTFKGTFDHGVMNGPGSEWNI